MGSSPFVSFDGVSLDFNGVPLFKDFGCTLPAGKTTCLLGPSGCGKSTLLGLISGNKALSFSGSVRLGTASTEEGEVGWMAQDDLLLPWLSVFDNMLLGARLRGEISSGLQQKALVLLEEAGLSDAVKKLPGELSGGMRQRTALLRTLMEERPVLLMDEPFSALDALTRMRLQDLAVSMTKGKTVVLVTHDPLEALRIGDMVVVLGGHPVKVRSAIELEGEAPRNVDDSYVTGKYREILQLVMEEGEQ